MSNRVIFDDRLEVKDKGIKQIESRERLANAILRAKWLSLLNGESFDNRSSMSLTEAMDLAKNGKWPETTKRMISDISENLGAIK